MLCTALCTAAAVHERGMQLLPAAAMAQARQAEAASRMRVVLLLAHAGGGCAPAASWACQAGRWMPSGTRTAPEQLSSCSRR
jgi:hypothetical protein